MNEHTRARGRKARTHIGDQIGDKMHRNRDLTCEMATKGTESRFVAFFRIILVSLRFTVYIHLQYLLQNIAFLHMYM